jgi:hypothetical protein
MVACHIDWPATYPGLRWRSAAGLMNNGLWAATTGAAFTSCQRAVHKPKVQATSDLASLSGWYAVFPCDSPLSLRLR